LCSSRRLRALKSFPGNSNSNCRLSVGSTGVVRVKYLSYLNVRGSYSNVLPNDFRMCAAAVTFCRNSPNGEECTVAKAFWGE
jgi:hypothetical protein